MANLKRCPFDNGVGHRKIVSSWGKTLHYIQCHRCGAQTPPAEPLELAEKYWNDRYQQDTGSIC